MLTPAPRGAIKIDDRPLPAAARTVDSPDCIEVQREGPARLSLGGRLIYR